MDSTHISHTAEFFSSLLGLDLSPFPTNRDLAFKTFFFWRFGLRPNRKIVNFYSHECESIGLL